MSPNDSFAVLMTRLRSGEDGAAREVFVRFAARLAGLARRHLDARMIAKVDPEDVVQSAYKSFFLRQRDGAFDVEQVPDVANARAELELAQADYARIRGGDRALDLDREFREVIDEYDRAGLPFERVLTRLSYARSRWGTLPTCLGVGSRFGNKTSLVPKLCLGTHIGEALLRAPFNIHAKQSFANWRSQGGLWERVRDSEIIACVESSTQETQGSPQRDGRRCAHQGHVQ